jgi:YVTN family beta-propeller protein
VNRYFLLLGAMFALAVLTPALVFDEKTVPAAPGFVLPNGWTVSPAGKQVPLRDLPLNIIPLADCSHALVATSGYNTHQLSLIDLVGQDQIAIERVRQSWFGLAVSAREDKVWWSGGGANMLHTFALGQGKLTLTSPREPDPEKMSKEERDKYEKAVSKQHAFRSALALDEKRQKLYSLDINSGTMSAIDLTDGGAAKPVPCGRRPYDVALARDGSRLYVSDWAGNQVLVVDPQDLRTVAKIAVGEHPNQIAIHPSGDRVFVACASSNCVSVIDTKQNAVTETIMTSLFPKAPEGSTPDAVAISADGATLYVANADNNCIAVIDVARANDSHVNGFIPTGWYPTAVAVTPDNKTVLVGVGKGNQTHPNPFDDNKPKKGSSRRPYPYIGNLLSGALSIVRRPSETELAAYTTIVYRNCPYSDKLLDNVPYPNKTAIPTRVGDTSPIKHVIYIIKENRTYDQVFGDMKEGNGDPSLVMFGEKVTPNHHKLAREFVLLDNLYCNAQVSRDGHPWSTMAYNTDYVARDWTLTYSRRKGVDDDEEGHLTRAPSGYLWDACARRGLSYRSYGEYGYRVSERDGSFRMEARVPGLVGHICPEFGIPKVPGQRARDTDNVDFFLKEFRQFEKDGNLPHFIVMSLGEDHTSGTRPGAFTPQACVASNDLALGRLVEEVSRSKYWPEIAIFVIEDDPQDGPDHVDCHRTVGLVVSPYTKRHHVDNTQYSTVSLLRSIELILGIPPLSQYDAAARPLFASFTDKPDLTPYQQIAAQVDLNTVNSKDAYGAERSEKMDLAENDRAEDRELNEILWRAVKGVNAPIPPVVRRAIVGRAVAPPT